MLFLELSIFSSFTSHPMWPMPSLAKLLFLDMLFLAGLFLAHSKFNFSCCTFSNRQFLVVHLDEPRFDCNQKTHPTMRFWLNLLAYVICDPFWEKVVVLEWNFIEIPKVNTQSNFTSFLSCGYQIWNPIRESNWCYYFGFIHSLDFVFNRWKLNRINPPKILSKMFLVFF